jgi:hypothetical protein
MGFFKRMLKRWFEGPFDVLAFGLTILALSIPGVVMIFVRSDVFAATKYFAVARDAAIVWGVSTFVIGAVLVFWGVRAYATPGTIIYHITHPRLFPR